MTAIERGWKYYNCGGSEWTSRQFRGYISPSLITESLIGVDGVVIDNYEFASKEDRDIIASIPHVEIYGTFGSDAEDYRMIDAKSWKSIQKDIQAGMISLSLALREFNISGHYYEVEKQSGE